VTHDSNRLRTPLREQFGKLLGHGRSPSKLSDMAMIRFTLVTYHINTIRNFWFRMSPPRRLSNPT